jgi:hypothetical protein
MAALTKVLQAVADKKAAAPPAAALPALPAGWVEHTDPTSNRHFYVNTTTQESTWMRPVVVVGPPPASSASQPAVGGGYASNPAPAASTANTSTPAVRYVSVSPRGMYCGGRGDFQTFCRVDDAECDGCSCATVECVLRVHIDIPHMSNDRSFLCSFSVSLLFLLVFLLPSGPPHMRTINPLQICLRGDLYRPHRRHHHR